MLNMKVQKDVQRRSLLVHSLKVYLNNKDRLQPLIGLSCVTECVNMGSNGEVFYLCEVCTSRLNKADIRSHIMGSLHRYNYIKAWHPHFVSEWKESADLSKLAWPLMDIAQTLEKREGTGDVQVLQCDAATYREMTSYSKVTTLLRDIKSRWEQSLTQTQVEESLTQPPECHAAQSQRVVLPPLTVHQKKAKVQLPKTVLSQNTSFQMQKPLTSIKRSASPSAPCKFPPKYVKLNNKKTSVELGNHKDVAHFYKGPKPLIGRGCVVECRNREGGSLAIYLCHCCRSKATRDDITEHLTSSSHHFNYIMEFHPDRMAVMRKGLSGDGPVLTLVAKKLELEEGRGKLKVVRVEASLCSQLSVNSYHWCIKNLSDLGGTPDTTIQNGEIPIHCVSRKQTASLPPMQCDRSSNTGGSKQMLKKETKCPGGSSTVFKVSLPLIEGQLLMERTSFSADALAEPATHSPPEDSALTLLPLATVSPMPLADGIHSMMLGHTPPERRFCTGTVERLSVPQLTGDDGGFIDSGSQKEGGYFIVMDDRIRQDSDQRVLSTSQLPLTTGLGEKVTVCVSTSRRQAHETEERVATVLIRNEDAIRSCACHTYEGMFDEGEEQTCHGHQSENRQTYYMHEDGFSDEERLNKSELQRRVELTVEMLKGEPQRETHYPYCPVQCIQKDFPNDIPGPDRCDPHERHVGPYGEYHTGWSHGVTQPYSDFPQTPQHTSMTQPNMYTPFPACNMVTFNSHHSDEFRTRYDLQTHRPDNHGERLISSIFSVPEQAEGFISHPGRYTRGTSNSQLGVMSGFGYGPAYESCQPTLSQSIPLFQAPYWDHSNCHATTQSIQHFC